jgi:hypothetical protein
MQLGFGDDIANQELKSLPKPALTIFEVGVASVLLLFVQRVQAAIEPILVDLFPRNAQQVLQCRALLPALGHAQFTLLRATVSSPAVRSPRNFFPTRRDQFVQRRVQSQTPP